MADHLSKNHKSISYLENQISELQVVTKEPETASLPASLRSNEPEVALYWHGGHHPLFSFEEKDRLDLEELLSFDDRPEEQELALADGLEPSSLYIALRDGGCMSQYAIPPAYTGSIAYAPCSVHDSWLTLPISEEQYNRLTEHLASFGVPVQEPPYAQTQKEGTLPDLSQTDRVIVVTDLSMGSLASQIRVFEEPDATQTIAQQFEKAAAMPKPDFAAGAPITQWSFYHGDKLLCSITQMQDYDYGWSHAMIDIDSQFWYAKLPAENAELLRDIA